MAVVGDVSGEGQTWILRKLKLGLSRRVEMSKNGII